MSGGFCYYHHNLLQPPSSPHRLYKGPKFGSVCRNLFIYALSRPPQSFTFAYQFVWPTPDALLLILIANFQHFPSTHLLPPFLSTGSCCPPSAYSQRRTEKNGSLLGTFFLSCFSATEAVEAAMIGKQIPSIRLCRLGWILWPFTIYHRLPQSTQTTARRGMRRGGREEGCQN